MSETNAAEPEQAGYEAACALEGKPLDEAHHAWGEPLNRIVHSHYFLRRPEDDSWLREHGAQTYPLFRRGFERRLSELIGDREEDDHA